MFPCSVGRVDLIPHTVPYPFTARMHLGKDEEEQMAVNVRVRGEFASQKKRSGMFCRLPFLKLNSSSITNDSVAAFEIYENCS